MTELRVQEMLILLRSPEEAEPFWTAKPRKRGFSQLVSTNYNKTAIQDANVSQNSFSSTREPTLEPYILR
jgi:hypothetical protein